MNSAQDFPLSGSLFHDRYRTIAESRIVEMLLLSGYAYQLSDPGSTAQTRSAVRDWVECGLPFLASGSGSRLFDPVEVWAVMKRLGREGRHPYWRNHEILTGRRLVNDLAASPAPDGPFTVEIRRTFDLTDVPSGRPLRLRLPLPLEKVHERSVTPLLPDGIGKDATVHANRMELRHTTAEQMFTLAARVAFTAPAETVADEDRGIYLRPREGLIVVSDRVRDLARRLAGPGASVTQAVRGFWIFLIENFTCGPVHYDQVDPAAPCDWVLDTGLYDCQLGSALFIALCRALDIPARLVGGQFLYRRAPANHFWAEYWHPDGGWTPVDFVGWGLSCGGEDPVWRDHFFGRLDARLVTQRLPLDFTGTPGIPMPPAWHMLNRATEDGIEIALTRLDGRPVYTDLVRLIDQ